VAYGPGFLGADDEKPMTVRARPGRIGADSQVEMLALADGERRVPLLLIGPDVRLIVLVPAELLATVATANARVFATPEHDAAWATIRPGVPIAPEAADASGWRRIRFLTPTVEVNGVIRADRVGHAFPYTPGYTDRGGNATIRGDTRFLASPRGPPLAALRAGALKQLEARTKGPPEGGHVRVHYAETNVAIEGWVPADAVRPQQPYGWGQSWYGGTASGIIGDVADGPTIRLPKGTRLRASAGGPTIGMITKDSEQRLGAAPDARRPPMILVRTVFGDAVLVAEQP
jgi:hypothetical protein